MLRNKDGVAAERSLLAVVLWLCRCQTFGDEITSVLQDSRHPLFLKIALLAYAEVETSPEARALQCNEEFIQIPHRLFLHLNPVISFLNRIK